MMPKPDSVTGSENKRQAISMDAVRMSLKNMKPSPLQQRMQMSEITQNLKLRPRSLNDVSHSIDRNKRGAVSEETRTEFVRSYCYADLGDKLKKLRPGIKNKSSSSSSNKFSLSELDERTLSLNEELRKLRKIEKKEIANTGGFSIGELRESLAKMEEDDKTKRNLAQRSNILGPLGGTPSFMLSPPKEVLVEKFVGLREIEKKENVVDELDETDHLVENNDIGLENLNDCDDVQVTSEVKAPTKKTSKSKKRKLEEDDVFFSKITSSLDNISSAIDRSTKVMENSRPHVYSEAEIYKVLELMGLECHEIPCAYLFLVDHPDKTRALFGAPNEMRLTILATMMAYYPCDNDGIVE